MFNNIKVSFIASRIRVDGKRRPDLIVDVSDINKYLKGSSFNTYSLMEDSLLDTFTEFDDLDCNATTVFELIRPIDFSSLSISFEASTYTAIRAIFTDDTILELMGENRDYINNDYSFDLLKNKYSGKMLKRIECDGSYGSEEFMSLTIKEN